MRHLIVVVWCAALAIIGVVIAKYLFLWEPILGGLWTVCCTVLVLYSLSESFRRTYQNTMLVAYLVATIDKVYVSGTFNRQQSVQEDEDVSPGEETSFLGLPDILFRLWPFYFVQTVPADLQEIPFDAVPVVTKEGIGPKGEQIPKTPLVVEGSLYIQLPHTVGGIAEFVTAIDVRRYGKDLTAKDRMKYIGFDEKKGLVPREEEGTRLAIHLKDDLQMTVHNTLITVIGEYGPYEVMQNTRAVIQEINRRLKETEVLKRIGFDQEGFLFEFAVERVVLDRESELAKPLIASLEADAESERGRGRAAYLRQVKQEGVTPTQALAADVLSKGQVTIVLADGGLVGAAATKLLGA